MSINAEELKRSIEGQGLRVDAVNSPEMAKRTLNVAPHNRSMVYCEVDGNMTLQAMEWMLQPSFAKKPMHFPTFNTRSESLDPLRGVWRSARYRRGVVFVEGYYEWIHTKSERLPYYIREKTDKLLLPLLVIWDRNEELSKVPTFSIVTTVAASDIAFVHERMPVAIEYNEVMEWITSKWPDALKVIRSLEGLTSYRVGKDVNRVGVDKPGLNQPLKKTTDTKTLHDFFGRKSKTPSRRPLKKEEKSDAEGQSPQRTPQQSADYDKRSGVKYEIAADSPPEKEGSHSKPACEDEDDTGATKRRRIV